MSHINKVALLNNSDSSDNDEEPPKKESWQQPLKVDQKGDNLQSFSQMVHVITYQLLKQEGGFTALIEALKLDAIFELF
jgi:hypothetical protein